MTALKRISILVVLAIAASPSWPAIYDFCKVKKIYNEQVATPSNTIYEDCAGVGYLVNGKNLAKAYCWNGANDCMKPLVKPQQAPSPSEPSSNAQEDIPLE